ncbi:MAG: homocysteine S-methyltransferase family protein [Spirochaetaceae bacterium]|nr:homocysteine S-methyltransferase family protein [Spirochaetaceae bacterium]
MSSLRDVLAGDRVLLYDGGFGTELFARGVDLPNSSLASELHPDVVQQVTQAYVEAGSDLVQTNTFVASPLHLAMAGRSAEDSAAIVDRAVRLARQAVDDAGRPVYVAGSLGPSPGAIEADAGDTTFGIPDVQVREAHRLVSGRLASAGADLLCIETMFSATEAAIAVDEARAFGLPIAVNLTLKYTRDRKSGATVYRTDWGHSCADLLDLLASGRYAANGDDLLPFVDVVGVNCGAEQRRAEHTGMPYAAEAIRQMQSALAERGIAGKRLMAYPNAGMPRIVAGATHYDHPPELMASHAPEVVAAGASIVGGCCGTGPEHIRAIRAALAAAPP